MTAAGRSSTSSMLPRRRSLRPLPEVDEAPHRARGALDVSTDPQPAITWGILPDGCLDRILLCSPHFDDAALGAAYLLFAHPGSTVVTVCGGRPAQYPDPPSEWDALGRLPGRRRCGRAAPRRRPRRDGRQLARLSVWLEFVDHQYQTPGNGPRRTGRSRARSRDRPGATDRGVPADGPGQPGSRAHARRRRVARGSPPT